MATARARGRSIAAYEIPRCNGYDWLVKPDEHGQGGKANFCQSIATHRIRSKAAHHQLLTWDVCTAHLAQELDRAEDSCRIARQIMFLTDVVDPVLTRVIITADTHAAAYGRTSYLLNETPMTGPIQIGLLGTRERIPRLPRPRSIRRPRTPASPVMQSTLF